MMPSSPRVALPALPGAYALHLHLPRPAEIQIGMLGLFDFSPGEWVYLGSAAGPGGLRARLGRHLAGSPYRRWHVDYLRSAAGVRAACFTITSPATKVPRIECCWSQALADLPGATIPVHNFGASDCAARCPAHLVHFSQDPGWSLPVAVLAQAASLSVERITCIPSN